MAIGARPGWIGCVAHRRPAAGQVDEPHAKIVFVPVTAAAVADSPARSDVLGSGGCCCCRSAGLSGGLSPLIVGSSAD